MLFATLEFDDEDPDLHVHMTERAHDLEDHNPRELVRVLRVMEHALHGQAARVARVRAKIQANLDAQDDQRRAAQ